MGMKIGLCGTARHTVEKKDTAKEVDSGLLEVYATPCMIALMESAAYSAVQKCLPEGMSTVGARMDAKHIAATPVGFTVWADAELTDIDGRKLTFRITAYDEKEKIGEAEHDRFVIDEKKFIQKVNAKGNTDR